MRALTISTVALEDGLLPDFELDEIPSRIQTMHDQEVSKTYYCFDYLKVNAALRLKSAKPVDEDCRVKMCEWCYQVVDFCKFRRETVGIGMSYLDRYLCSDKGGKSALGDRKEYQLVAMTCLYIAIKLHEPLEMETSLLADLSRGCYTEMEFANMEKKILEALIWRVNGPTALAFIQHYMIFLSTMHSPTQFDNKIPKCVLEAVFDYARYQTELAVGDHAFVQIAPSIVGMAALLNAMEGMDTTLLPLKIQAKFQRTVLKCLSDMDLEKVAETQSRLSMLLISLLSEDTTKQLNKEIDALPDDQDELFDLEQYYTSEDDSDVEESEEEDDDDDDTDAHAEFDDGDYVSESGDSFEEESSEDVSLVEEDYIQEEPEEEEAESSSEEEQEEDESKPSITRPSPVSVARGNTPSNTSNNNNKPTKGRSGHKHPVQ